MIIRNTVIEKADLRLALSLGLGQTVAWAAPYYLPAILARPMADDLGCSVSSVYAAFSLALIISALTMPLAGRCVDKWGGKPVLVASNVWFALGLVFLSHAQSEASLFSGWILLGFAMGAGLYDMAFATAVRSRGSAAPLVIIGITLLGGFGSTVGWPVSHYLLSSFGWRHALLTWAGIHLFLALPLHLSLASPMRQNSVKDSETQVVPSSEAEKSDMPAMLVMSLAFTCAVFASGAMAGHMPGLLRLFGVSAAVSILAGAMFGPAQVSGRLIYLFALQKLQPVNVIIVYALIMPIGALSLALFGPGAALSVAVTHGLGNGLVYTLRGTLPLSLFGEKGYGRRQGLLFMPAGFAQALSPFLFSLCIDMWSRDALYVYIAAIWTAALLFLWLKRLTDRSSRA